MKTLKALLITTGLILFASVCQALTNTPTATATATNTSTSTQTAAATATTTATSTQTVTANMTQTDAVLTASQTFTATATHTYATTRSYTVTKTATRTATGTRTPFLSKTYTATATATNTATSTVTVSTSTATNTSTATRTATNTNTKTATATATSTVTATATFTNTFTFTNTPTTAPTMAYTFVAATIRVKGLIVDNSGSEHKPIYFIKSGTMSDMYQLVTTTANKVTLLDWVLISSSSSAVIYLQGLPSGITLTGNIYLAPNGFVPYVVGGESMIGKTNFGDGIYLRVIGGGSWTGGLTGEYWSH